MLMHLQFLSRRQQFFIGLLLVCVISILIANAWVAEDAFITFRVLDNAVHGYGLRWNVAERVQVFTHPLWLLLLLPFYSVTHEPYLTSIVVSLMLSIVALVVGLRFIARSYESAAFLLLAVVFASPFVDFATSGLENALAYMLAAVFFALSKKDQPPVLAISGIASLLMLTRPDYVLLVGPMLIFVLIQGRLKLGVVRNFLLGMIPLFLWELFSLWYYGFLFPNTAYAKLNVAISRQDLVLQGLRYLGDALIYHPIVVAVVALAFLLAFVRGIKTSKVIMAGVGLYVLYVVWVGGDFMSGRLLVVPFWISVLVCVRNWPKNKTVQTICFVLVLVLGSLSSRPIWVLTEKKDDSNYGFRFNGVIDEKSHYFAWTGLLREGYTNQFNNSWVQDGLHVRGRPSVVVLKNIGLYGYYAGPEVHIIDVFALADPLLARIPTIIEDPTPYVAITPWRIGHFRRLVPLLYQESIIQDQNMLEDPELAQLYDDIRLITRGPLWSKERLKKVFAHILI